VACGLEVRVALDQAGVEAPLEEVADAVVATVEALGVQSVETLHPRGEFGLRRLDDEVEVVVEQDPDVHSPAEPLLHVLQTPLPPTAVDVVLDDRSLLDAARSNDVAGRTG
jgi:hypothetical protein